MTHGNVCKLCGYQFEEENLEESIEQHLKEKHFLGYQDYYEIITTGEPSGVCWKCGNPRYTISPWLDHFHLPCSCCINFDNKHNLSEIQNEVISVVKGFQGRLLKDKYTQYILSISPQERQRLLPKSFQTISDILLDLKRQKRARIDKSHLIRVTNILGTSPEISKRNLGNLDLELIDFKVCHLGDGRFEMGDSGYCIGLPEVTSYDGRHHSRNSILNPAAKRSSKRLKITDGDCIKFFSTPNPTVRSILALYDKSGKQVSLGDLSEETQWRIKFGILKTKEILSRVFEVYNEILKFIFWMEDPVFLLNSVTLPLPNLEMGMVLKWSWEEHDYENLGGETIKLSIL